MTTSIILNISMHNVLPFSPFLSKCHSCHFQKFHLLTKNPFLSTPKYSLCLELLKTHISQTILIHVTWGSLEREGLRLFKPYSFLHQKSINIKFVGSFDIQFRIQYLFSFITFHYKTKFSQEEYSGDQDLLDKFYGKKTLMCGTS